MSTGAAPSKELRLHEFYRSVKTALQRCVEQVSQLVYDVIAFRV